ncbi:uncharacterized protein LOC134310679 [Trichomycterus rosablanca]|uniref:uncharacterized protein LOC134310679 n=1 Tax=Trichomycterus rosablanca TaxID=2290929 RepID=UPI002F35D770
MACAAGLIAIGSAVYWAYCRLRRRTDPPTELPQPDSHGKQSPLCGGRELNSTCQIIQFLSYESRHSQSESEEIRRYFVSMTKGSEIQQWWFTITETCHLNHLGFPYYTSSEDSFTGIQSVSGRMMEVLSCCRLDTFVNVPLEDCVQTFYEVTRDYWRMRAEGHEDAAHWVKTSTFNTSGSDSETLSESDSEESEESHSVEESKLPFISCHLADCDIADVALKLPALREVFSIERGFLDKIVNWDVESWEPAAKQCFMVLIVHQIRELNSSCFILV